MSAFWLVAMNGTQARIFEGAGPAAALQEIECLVNPSGRSHERDFLSDRPGRFPDTYGKARSAVEESTPHDHSLDEFARRIADYLRSGHEEGTFATVSVVASPAMLGRLRGMLPKSVRDAVLEEVDKDLTHAQPADIQAVLQRLH